MLLYISEHPTGLKVFETENQKRTNSDRTNFQNMHVINPFQACVPFLHLLFSDV